MFRWFDLLMVNDADNLSEEPRLTNIFFTRMKMQLCHSFHLPTTRSLFKVDQSSHVQFIDKNILMISNTFIQDAQRAVSVKKRSTYDTGGRTRSEGNVLVRGRPVCDDGWGDNEADVACRLGLVIFVSIPCGG